MGKQDGTTQDGQPPLFADPVRQTVAELIQRLFNARLIMEEELGRIASIPASSRDIVRPIASAGTPGDGGTRHGTHALKDAIAIAPTHMRRTTKTHADGGWLVSLWLMCHLGTVTLYTAVTVGEFHDGVADVFAPPFVPECLSDPRHAPGTRCASTRARHNAVIERK